MFVTSYHCSITEAHLTVITSTLHSLKQSSADSLTSHMDKFNLVLNEFYKFSGEISETQAARLLISTLLPEYDTTIKRISHDGERSIHSESECHTPGIGRPVRGLSQLRSVPAQLGGGTQFFKSVKLR